MKNQPLSPNMTKKHLQDVMDALPDNIHEGELCAITLAIHRMYLKTDVEIISALISAIYTYGTAQGISAEIISLGLRETADLQDKHTETKH